MSLDLDERRIHRHAVTEVNEDYLMEMKSTGRDLFQSQVVHSAHSQKSKETEREDFEDFFEDSDIDNDEFREEMRQHVCEERSGKREISLDGLLFLIQKANSFNGIRHLTRLFKEKRRAVGTTRSLVNIFKKSQAKLEPIFKANVE
mmetsp:Transcript_34721/g.25867  ORF Transcript_34721/g.25867 Transcript_34721/m.25867 type:complete len:146 (-) Transcript_34721:634-1071(-)